MLRRVTTSLAGLCLAALTAGALAVPPGAAAGTGTASFGATPGTAGTVATARQARPKVASRAVEFTLTNVNETSVPCVADGEEYQVRGRLVRPRNAARNAVIRVNVLVHDAGTGAWFWNMKKAPGVDYATQLARKGETSLVLDRLGYDRSPLADGRSTCLGAQAQMLHQVVQHLYSGIYRYADGKGRPPHASHVVVHGHGTGATVAQLEAAEFDDTAGLVLMSSPSAVPSRLATSQLAAQTTRCLRGEDYSSYGGSAQEFRSLLFVSAKAKVRRLATRQRNATPCGDVTSLAGAVTSATVGAAYVEVPVLLLTGARDARNRPLGAGEARLLFRSSEDVRTRTIAGAGSALPLEGRAGEVRRTVLRWLAQR